MLWWKMNEPHKTMPSISSSCNFILPWLQNLTSSFVYSWEIIPPVANFLVCAFCHLENSCDSIAPLDWLILLVTRSGEGRKSREQADLHILVLASCLVICVGEFQSWAKQPTRFVTLSWRCLDLLFWCLVWDQNSVCGH